jgi:hypothetical protein
VHVTIKEGSVEISKYLMIRTRMSFGKVSTRPAEMDVVFIIVGVLEVEIVLGVVVVLETVVVLGTIIEFGEEFPIFKMLILEMSSFVII